MNILYYILPFITSIVITPLIRNYALRNRIIDKADGNPLKIHKKSVPLMGGFSILTATAIGLIVMSYDIPSIDYAFMSWIITGGMLVFGIGLIDDIKPVRPDIRIAVQIVSGIMIVFAGMRISLNVISWIAIPVTVFYIIGAINAFNVIDGMDGLCAGVALIACIGFFFLGLRNGNILLTALSVVLFMSLLGFLPYNFHPAKIFLGDAGSGFIGYMLGVMAVMATAEPCGLVGFIVPILIISVPVLDMSFAILRRMIKRQSLFKGDRDHLYDLVNRKFNVIETVIVCYELQFMLVVTGIMIIAP